MTTPRWLIDRRTMLRGLGVSMALPLLNVMTPPKIYGADYKVVPKKIPVRYLAMYVPNGLAPTPQGKEADKWTPKEGPLVELPEMLKSLEKTKSQVLVLSGMHNELPLKTKGGHHPRATGFLCSSMVHGGTEAAKGGEINSGSMSIDQLMASSLGAFTKLPSIELAMEIPGKGFASNTGENILYGSHLSWSSPTSPISPEIDPKAVFDRLFRTQGKAGGAQAVPISADDDQSVLDAVLANLTSFSSTVGVEDRRKLDEFTSSVRELEKRLEREVKSAKAPRRIDPAATRALPELEKQTSAVGAVGKRGNTQGAMQAMLDIITLAFWTDTTRIGTFHTGNEVSGRNFSFIKGVTGSHHEMSHHENKADKLAQYIKIGISHIEQYAYLINRLSVIKEEGGTLLDNCMVMIGSGIRDGNKHDGKDLPIILAGGGGGTLKGGRHLNVGKGTPLANLHVEMAQRMGVQVPKFADSTGPLKGL